MSGDQIPSLPGKKRRQMPGENVEASNWLVHKLEKSQIFHVTFVDVAWCFTCLDSLVQQCCVNQGMHTSSICNTQLVITGWPNMCNMSPQQHWGMLQLFGWVYKHWTNNVGSITSRCSGKEPALLPRTHGWTHGLSIVNFDQWKICLPESSRLHKLSFSQ